MPNSSRDLELEKQIDAYIKGRLSDDEAERLWIELLKKPYYIDLLDTELAVKAILEENISQASDSESGAGPAHKGPSIPFIRSWKWLAAAATVAILVVSISVFRSETVETLRDMALKDINIVENLASPEIVRAQKSDLTPVDSLLNIGYKAAISGHLKDALRIYNEVIANYKDMPAVAQAYLNIGIIEYNQEDFEAASIALKKALSYVKGDNLLSEKANWYLGNAYINLDSLELAREAMNKVSSLGGIYQQTAMRLLDKLNAELGTADSNKIKNQD